MLEEINREELPTIKKIYDVNDNKGVIIGNIMIFNEVRKETQKIKKIYKEVGKIRPQEFYVEFEEDPILYKIFIERD